jgi:hypothetical protein
VRAVLLAANAGRIPTRNEENTMSTIHIPHKIGSEGTFAALCSALLQDGVRFIARDNGNEYTIELQGYKS